VYFIYMHDLYSGKRFTKCTDLLLFVINVKKRKWFRYLAIREKSIYIKPFMLLVTN
jgi:hypothetical protein